MRNSKPASGDRQASPDDDTEKNSRTRHTRRVFAWLDIVVADTKLSSSAFRVAYVIAQHWNRKTGVAFPSTETIASKGGLAPSTVRAGVDDLEVRGHVVVDRGSRGRGHPNKYQPIIKQRTVAVLEPTKDGVGVGLNEAAKGRFQRLKPRSDDVKPRRSAMNNLLPTVTTKRAASPPPLVDRVELVSPVTEDRNALAYGALIRLYPKYPPDGLDHQCQETFYRLLDEGTNPDSILDGAAVYAGDSEEQDQKNIKPLAFFFLVRGWEYGRGHLMFAVNE